MTNDETVMTTETPKKERTVSQFLRDLWLLMKPELTLLSVFTSLGSAFLAIQHSSETALLTFPLLASGTLLVGGGAGALNQFAERNLDRLMQRTLRRPLPDGRVEPAEALIFGLGATVTGLLLLFLINTTAFLLALATSVSYVLLYTPLKRISSVSTIIGAIPGALPTLIGWGSIDPSLSIRSLTLFAILFYWQMPHFYSIGWLYRVDYRKAGFQLLTSLDLSGKKVARHVVLNQILLLVISLSPWLLGMVNGWYLAVAFITGTVFLWTGIRFARTVTAEDTGSSARVLFFTSLFYLPIIFSGLIICKVD